MFSRCAIVEFVYLRITPAIVYFPKGYVHAATSFTSPLHLTRLLIFLNNRTYLVSAPILAYYYTQIIGDAKNPPTLLAAPHFTGLAVIGWSSSHEG